METLTAPESGSDPAPTRTFAFEPVQARQLEWLPLAVRYKLDRCALRIRLRQWQALDLSRRASLLACPEGPAFRRQMAELFGAECRGEPAGEVPDSFRDYLDRKRGARTGASSPGGL